MIVHIKDGAGISNTTYHRRCHGRQGYWWLRSDYGFVTIGEYRGDKDIDISIELSPGKYVLGTGPGGKFGYRRNILVE